MLNIKRQNQNYKSFVKIYNNITMCKMHTAVVVCNRLWIVCKIHKSILVEACLH